MCQLNLVFIKNSTNKKILKNEEYEYFSEKYKEFSPYIKGYCNCGSFVGSMSEYDGKSYLEMIENINTEELKKLQKIKEFMNKPDYKKQKEKYVTEKEKLSNMLEKFFEPLTDYEIEQISILEKKYKGNALDKQMERFYGTLDKKAEEIENSAEYKLAESKLHEFIEKNELMEDSTMYFLTKEEEENERKAEEITDTDLFGDMDDSIEYIDIPEESLVIDTVIKNIENRYTKDYDTFLEYKKLFEKLLENEECILFCCIWDEPTKLTIKKEINIKDIKIEDLASLEYNQILKICK